VNLPSILRIIHPLPILRPHLLPNPQPHASPPLRLNHRRLRYLLRCACRRLRYLLSLSSRRLHPRSLLRRVLTGVRHSCLVCLYWGSLRHLGLRWGRLCGLRLDFGSVLRCVPLSVRPRRYRS